MEREDGLQELSLAATQILSRVRKMAARGNSRGNIDSFLTECRHGFLNAAHEAQTEGHNETIEDMARAMRHTSSYGEVLGALIVLAAISGEMVGRGMTSFKMASISATQKVRAEMRDHFLCDICEPEEIRMGAELALHSLQPISEPFQPELLAA